MRPKRLFHQYLVRVIRHEILTEFHTNILLFCKKSQCFETVFAFTAKAEVPDRTWK